LVLSVTAVLPVTLSVIEPMNAEEAFAKLREARKQMNKLYNQVAKERPRANLPQASNTGAGAG